MNIGMLWFDNDKNTNIPAKLERAVKYYREKYKQEPDICYLNPQMVSASGKTLSKKSNGKDKQLTIGAIEVHQNPMVLPNHFWIGISTGQSSQAG